MGMVVEERVGRLEGEQSSMSSRLDDLRSDMNFRFSVVFRLLIAILGIGVTMLGIGVTILLNLL